jgi:hypothetical protein
LCPPETAKLDYSYVKSGYRSWMLQRPGNYEDDYTAQFCGEYLIPALRRAGHCVDPQRAIDPSTGELDTTPTIVTPEAVPGLLPEQGKAFPRWRYSAAVEGALRGIQACRTWQGRWSFDPVASTRWEVGVPDSCSKELYLSIHQNWWDSAKMFGSVVLHSGSRMSTAIAKSIWGSVLDAFKNDEWAEETRIPHWPDRLKYKLRTGSRWQRRKSRLWEIRRTRRPAVLIELGFASNAEDTTRMHDPDWCHKYAEAVTRGISKA